MSNLPVCITLLLSLFLSSVHSYAQNILVNRDWSLQIGDPSDVDWADMQTDLNGNIYLSGNSSTGFGFYSLYLTKLSPNGDQLWSKNYSLGGRNLYGVKVRVDDVGNVYAMSISELPEGGNYDWHLFKYGSNGQLLWNYNYTTDGDDIPTDFQIDASSNIYMTGASYGTNSLSLDFLTLMLNAAGNKVWEARYNHNGHIDIAAAIALDPISGEVVVTGGSGVDELNWDIATVKYSSTGQHIYTHRLDNPGFGLDRPGGLAIDGEGNIYLGGSISLGLEVSEIVLLKLSNALSEQWQTSFKGNGTELGVNDLKLSPSGRIIVGGYAVNGFGEREQLVLRCNRRGIIRWANQRPSFKAGESSEAKFVSVDDQENILTTGLRTKDGKTSTITTMMNVDGKTKWERFHTAPNGRSQPVGIVRNQKQVYVGGIDKGNQPTDRKYFVDKYSICEREMTVASDNEGDSKFIEDEVIVRFDPSVIDQTFMADQEQTYGTLCNIVTDEALIGQMRGAMESGDICNCKVIKVFPKVKPTNSCVTTSAGLEIPMPDVWSTMILKDCYSGVIQSRTNAIDFGQALNDLPTRSIRYAHEHFLGSVGISCDSDTPNDPFATGKQYQHSLFDYGEYPDAHINICEAWEKTTGQSADPEDPVHIGVFDTGVLVSHEDLAGVVEGSWDFTEGSITPIVDDVNGHGTNCAGISAAVTNNGIGIAGIAGGDAAQNIEGAKVYSYKICSDGSSCLAAAYSNAIMAIIEGQVDRPDIINMSAFFAGPQSNTKTIVREATRIAHESGLIISGITGNDGETTPKTPGDLEDDWMMLTSSHGTDGNIKTASNNGLPIFEPGETGITCTTTATNGLFDAYSANTGTPTDFLAPGSVRLVATLGSGSDSDYTCFSGTSAASPHTVGVGALLLSCNPDLSIEDIETILQYTATEIGGDGEDPINGWGRLNGGAAVGLLGECKILHFDNILPDKSTCVCDLEIEDNASCFATFEKGYKSIEESDVLEARITKHTKRIVIEAGTSPDAEIVEFYLGDMDKPGYWVRNSASTAFSAPNDLGGSISCADGGYSFNPKRGVAFEGTPQISADKKTFEATLVGYTYELFEFNNDTGEYDPVLKLPEGGCDPPIFAMSLMVKDGDFTLNNEELTAIQPKLDIWPNPANEKVLLRMGEITNQKVDIHITDGQGRLIKSIATTAAADLWIPVSDLQAGMYFLNVSSQGRTFATEKFIKL